MCQGDTGKTLSDLHEYWRSPDQTNVPQTYTLGGVGRSLFLLDRLREIVTPKARILEIGCNAGRNLSFLYNANYRNLSGVEINADAVSHMRRTYPELSDVSIICAPIEDVIGSVSNDEYDLIFTVAVLEHLHWDSEWVFGEMCRVARRVVTIEDEATVSPRHFRRNYQKVFERRGLYEVASQANVPGLPRSFVYRYFDRYKSVPKAVRPDRESLEELFDLLGPADRDLEEKLLAILQNVAPDRSPEVIAGRVGASPQLVRLALRLFVAAGFYAYLTPDGRCQLNGFDGALTTKELVKSLQRHIKARWY